MIDSCVGSLQYEAVYIHCNGDLQKCGVADRSRAGRNTVWRMGENANYVADVVAAVVIGLQNTRRSHPVCGRGGLWRGVRVV